MINYAGQIAVLECGAVELYRGANWRPLLIPPNFLADSLGVNGRAVILGLERNLESSAGCKEHWTIVLGKKRWLHSNGNAPVAIRATRQSAFGSQRSCLFSISN